MQPFKVILQRIERLSPIEMVAIFMLILGVVMLIWNPLPAPGPPLR